MNQIKDNQKDLDRDKYLSEDGIICKKGRTEGYILTKDSLNIHGPKLYKFGEPHLNWYFLSKTSAEQFKEELLKPKKKVRKPREPKKPTIKKKVSKTLKK